MPHRLKERQRKIQEKRKQTPWREFVMEICSWRNLMFYKNEVGISKYPQDTSRKMNLISLQEYAKRPSGDIVFGKSYDPQKPFTEQLNELYQTYPFSVVNHYGLQENALWGDEVWGAKNVYLSVAVGDDAENVLYTFKGETHVKNIISCSNITQRSENVYLSKTVRGGTQIFYSRYIYNCSDIRFSSNLIGCTECILCSDLQQASYYIENVPYEKDAYLKRKKEILSKKDMYDVYAEQVTTIGKNYLSEGVTGSSLYNCHSIENGYELSNISDARNIVYTDGGADSSDCYDVIDSASDRTHHLYAVMGQAFGDHVYCSGNIVESSYMYYSFMCQNSHHCLGCFRLVGKSYCIFNTQYTKEERYEKVDEIFSDMEQQGILGKFFPGQMNPFYFNDTAAYLIDPSFTKEEVEAKGFLRRDDPIKVDIPEGVQTTCVDELYRYEGRTVGTEYLPSSGRDIPEEAIRTIDTEILKKVIVDEEGNAWRVIPLELEFLQKYGLPLPRKHWLERLKGHFSIGRST